MSGPFGIVPSGFNPMLTPDVEAAIQTGMEANVDPNIDLSPDQALGQFMSIVADQAAQIWEVLDVLWAQLNPNNAEGFVLDADCAYTGTKRESPTFSTVVAQMNLNSTVSVAAGSLANVNSQPANQWQLMGPADPTSGLLIAPGPVVSTTAGTYLGFFQATSPGPMQANAGALTVITASVSGWNSVTNAAAAIPGAVLESDSALNVRREAELSAAGGATIDAMRADLLNETLVPGVIDAFVSENTGDVIDVNGLPPHSVHVVIYDGIIPAAQNSAIAAVIWKDKGSGIQLMGSTAVQTPDSTGTLRTVQFDRAAIVPYWVSVTTTRGQTFDAVNGPLAIKNALVAYWNSVQGLNTEVVLRQLAGGVLSNPLYAVLGLVDFPTFCIGTSPSPTGTANLAALLTGIYTLTVADILVDGS